MEGRLYGILRGPMLQGRQSNTWHIILWVRAEWKAAWAACTASSELQTKRLRRRASVLTLSVASGWLEPRELRTKRLRRRASELTLSVASGWLEPRELRTKRLRHIWTNLERSLGMTGAQRKADKHLWRRASELTLSVASGWLEPRELRTKPLWRRAPVTLKRGLGMTGTQRVADKTFAAPRIWTNLKCCLGMTGTQRVADKTFAAPRICTYLERGLGMTRAQRGANKTFAVARQIWTNETFATHLK
jgi:hypothetical protein